MEEVIGLCAICKKEVYKSDEWFGDYYSKIHTVCHKKSSFAKDYLDHCIFQKRLEESKNNKVIKK